MMGVALVSGLLALVGMLIGLRLNLTSDAKRELREAYSSWAHAVLIDSVHVDHIRGVLDEFQETIEGSPSTATLDRGGTELRRLQVARVEDFRRRMDAQYRLLLLETNSKFRTRIEAIADLLWYRGDNLDAQRPPDGEQARALLEKLVQSLAESRHLQPVMLFRIW